MHGPAADRFERQVMVRQPPLQPGSEMRSDQIRDLGGQAHHEAVILNRPRHGLGAGGHQEGATGDPSPQPRRGFHHRRRPCPGGHQSGGAVGEQGIGHDPFGLPAVLQVQAAELDGAEQHAGLGIGAGEAGRHPQSVEGGMTAHESHMGAGHAGAQRQGGHQG